VDERSAFKYRAAVAAQRRGRHENVDGRASRRSARSDPELTPPDALGAAFDAIESIVADDTLAVWPTRSDEALAIRIARERLERRYTLAVVGEFSSGKSYLLNALLEQARYDEGGKIAGLLATDINPSTATITELRYGAERRAIATYPSGRTERIPFDRLSRFIAVGKNDAPGSLHDATADDDAAPEAVVIDVDSPFLHRGFVVADTPGLASLNPAHRRATLGYLPRTDAVLYLIDSQQPFSEGDAAFLGLIGEHVRTIFIVQTKIDLWRQPEGDGEAWQAARARIVERAKRFAPQATVFSVSAYDYASALLERDAEAAARSGFPDLIAGLDRSLEERVRAARIARAVATIADIARKISARLRRAAALAESDAPALVRERARAQEQLTDRERALSRERDDVTRAGASRRAWIAARGETLATDAVRALGSAIDVADVGRLRDRGRLHALVDATATPVWNGFAHEVAADVARELERIGERRSGIRVVDIAARRLGGEPGAGAWSRDLNRGIASTIVLGAIGGPTVSLVDAVARGFAGRPPGDYMKRELGADLGSTIFPAFARDVGGFVAELAERIASIYDDTSAAIGHERTVLRAETLEPLERALAIAGNAEAAAAERRRLDATGAILTRAESLLLEIDLPPAGSDQEADAAQPAEPARAFDADAYDAALNPARYRVVLLGALRRGKSSLINAIAGTRLLHDDSASEALFPVHVRYGERERAYALISRESWTEIPVTRAMAQAATTPVLIETPWAMPRELVLVHAPAFDGGSPDAETIALAAARHASEVLGLFSRQLSDRELAVYERVAAFERPMLLAHTIADHESGSERRTVVDLAERYVRERGIVVPRIFTISALDALEAAQTGRPAAPWNELAALRDTLRAHAEEHMRRSAERERMRERFASGVAPGDRSSPKLRTALDRLFGRRS